LIRFIKNTLKTEFTKNIITVLSGSTFSTLLPIIISPILTRLFNATDDFAPFAFFISTCYIIASIANSHYTTAILVADSDEESTTVFQLSAIINLLAFFVLSIVILCTGKKIMQYFNAPNSFIGFLWLVPITVLIMGMYANFLQQSFRAKKFKRVALSRMLQSTITAITQIGFGVYVKNINGLIIGFVAGQFISLLVIGILSFLENNNKYFNYNIKSLIFCSRKYGMFFTYQTLADFINVLTQQMPTFLLGRFNFIQEVGWFGFANRIIIAPSSIVTGAIGDVFRQKASVDFTQQKNALAIFNKTLKILLATMVLPSLAVLIAGPKIFSFLFGSEWIMAGTYAQVLIIMLFPKFIVSPLSYMYIIARKQKEDFLLHLYILCSTILSFYIGFQLFHTAIGMLLCFSINYAIIYAIYFFRSYTFAKGEKILQ
jgi:O-antigen/teichoic acid export membrane protein